MYYYFIFVIPALLLSVLAQILVKSAFSKYSKVLTASNITGKQASVLLMRSSGISNVVVQKTAGSLTDHYDPSRKVLKLSEPVYDKTSVSAVGVAAHETGHAMQDKENYGPLVLRGTLVPAANIGSTIGPYLATFGLIFGLSQLFTIGIILFSVAVLFYIITLPVEFDASRRAVAMLKDAGILTEAELRGVKTVLTVAALTYVASALTAVANLLYLIMSSRNRD